MGDGPDDSHRPHPTAAMASQLLAWMQDTKGSAKDAAQHFLKTREDVWTKWVSNDVAKRVKNALSAS